MFPAQSQDSGYAEAQEEHRIMKEGYNRGEVAVKRGLSPLIHV